MSATSELKTWKFAGQCMGTGYGCYPTKGSNLGIETVEADTEEEAIAIVAKRWNATAVEKLTRTLVGGYYWILTDPAESTGHSWELVID